MQGVPANMDPSLTLDFQTWKPGSATYANVDAELSVRITALYFFGNRPTIGALMGIGGDLGDAFKDPQNPPPLDAPEGTRAPARRESAASEEDDLERALSSDDTSGAASNLCADVNARNDCWHFCRIIGPAI